MKNRVWKGLSLLLVTAMTTGLVACGTEEQTGKTVVESSTQEQEKEEGGEIKEEDNVKTWTDDDSAEITIFLAGDNTPNEENMVLDALEEKTGTKINMIYVTAADASTKLNTLIAGGDMPDIFVASQSTAQGLKDKGLLADMTDVLNAVAPNVLADTGSVLGSISVNQDGIYMIPNATRENTASLVVRTDWLENLGMDQPTDLESLAEVYHAFTYDDPDGNGVDDTYGYGFNLPNMLYGASFEEVFGAFGIPKRQIVLEDGTVTTWMKHPNFIEAITYIKGLLDDGVCDPEYITIPNMNMFEKLWNGTYGAFSWSPTGPLNSWLTRYVEDPIPTFCTPTIVGEDGQFGVANRYISTSNGYVFSAACENLEGAARIANFCMSEEGSELLYLGVEGVMFEWLDEENGQYQYLGEYADSTTQRAAGGYCYWNLFTPSNNAQLRTLSKQAQDAVKTGYENGIEWANTMGTSQTMTEYGGEMDGILQEMMAELLATDIENLQAVYDEYIQEWENAGGSDYEDEITEIYNSEKN